MNHMTLIKRFVRNYTVPLVCTHYYASKVHFTNCKFLFRNASYRKNYHPHKPLKYKK